MDRIVTDINTIAGSASIICNILVLSTILRFKRLRCQMMNIIFVNKYIMESAFILCIILATRLEFNSRWLDLKSYTASCMSLAHQPIFTFGTFFFVGMSVCDFLVQLCAKNRYGRFCFVFKLVTVLTYVVLGFLIVTIILACLDVEIRYHHHIVFFSLYAFIFFMACIFLFIIIANIYYMIKKLSRPFDDNNHLGLALANISTLTWLPLAIFMYIEWFSQVYFSYLETVTEICYIIAISAPMVNLFYLLNFDKDYKMLLKKVCVSTYEDSGDDHSQPVTYRAVNGNDADDNFSSS